MYPARSHKSLPVAEWPAVDREASRKANDPGDEFSGWGIASQWAPRSRENAELAYGRYLGFLRRNSRLHPVRRVGERLMPEDLRAFGYELSAQLASFTVLGIFSTLNMAFKAMDATADRTFLIMITSRLSLTAKSVRDIGGNLLSPRQLVKIGTSMMEKAEGQTRRSSRRAALYRDGLLIMFMTLCPLRPGVVTELQIGTHLLVEGDSVTIRLPPEKCKKRRPEYVPLTDELTSRILRYLGYYRPMFASPTPEHAQALWISWSRNALGRNSLSRIIKERINRRTGKSFTAHMFRHAAASYIVDVGPERARMIVGVLGHAGFRTAQRHYIKGQQHVAVKKHQGAVRDLMRRGQTRRTHRSQGTRARPTHSKRRGRNE
jgi:integrase/recombinase XerD